MTPELAAGGAERQWSILIPGLRRRGHDARVLCLSGGGPMAESLAQAKVPVEILGAPVGRWYKCLRESSVLHDFAPDAVVTRPVTGQYVGNLIARRHGSLRVFNHHRPPGLLLSRKRMLLTRAIAHETDLVIAVSSRQIPDLVRLGFKADRIAVVPNSAPHHRPTISRGDMRFQLDLAENDVLVLLVANLRPEKRIEDFIMAVHHARRRASELHGIVVGDGSERARLQAFADRYPGTRFLGYRSDIANLLNASDVFALTSVREALPMALLEAMAASLPCVATDVGAVSDVLSAAEGGVVTAPGDAHAIADALVQFARDPRQRKELGLRGYRYVAEHLSADAMVTGYELTLSAAMAGAALQE